MACGLAETFFRGHADFMEKSKYFFCISSGRRFRRFWHAVEVGFGYSVYFLFQMAIREVLPRHLRNVPMPLKAGASPRRPLTSPPPPLSASLVFWRTRCPAASHRDDENLFARGLEEGGPSPTLVHRRGWS